MSIDEPTDALKEHERIAIQKMHRGRVLGPGQWRNFCCRCGLPLTVTHEWMKNKTDLTCDECRPPIEKGGQMATAFSSEKKGGYE